MCLSRFTIYNQTVRILMRTVRSFLFMFVVLACAVALAQAGGVQAPRAKTAGSKSQATGGAKSQAGFDMKAIDKSVSPCDNFYQFACGSWIKNNPIPADQSRWGRFNELIERNNDILRGILEKASKGGTARSATDQKIGDFYGACMDETA